MTNTEDSNDGERQYEKSGLYPKKGKPFRLIALVVALTGVLVFLAGVAALLDTLLI